MFSIFPNVKAADKPYKCTIKTAMKRIKEGESQTLVNEIRKESDKEKRNNLKAKLPAYTFSGQFSRRSKKAIISHSGIICLDFDDVPNPEELKEELKEDVHTLACFISPSGNGVKLLVRITPTIEEHENRYIAALSHYNNPFIDLGTKDICRACYESFDPELYYNPDAEVFDKIFIPVQDQKASYSSGGGKAMTGTEALNWVLERVNKKITFGEGQKFYHLQKFAGMANRCGVDVNDTISFYTANFQKKKASSIIKGIYKNASSDFNADPIIKRSATQAQTRSQPSESKGERSMTQLGTFWYVSINKEGKTKIHFKRSEFLEWLQSNGLGRYYYTEKDWMIVRITDNIVEEVLIPEIKEQVLAYIKALPEEFDNITRSELKEFILKGSNVYFSMSLMEFIERIEVQFCTDTNKNAFFFFKNTAVKVEAGTIKPLEYSQLPGKIWKSQKLERDYKPAKSDNCEYERFIALTQDESPRRITAIKSIIGYILHNYKDPAMAKAIIVNDKQVSENPEGGTGKGLFIKSFNHIKRLVIIPGKGFNFDKNFAMQRVELGTQILAFEDVEKNFDFEKMFSIITDGITVEKKGMQEFFIPFNESPKILITTNYTIKGHGNSHDRRRQEVEFGRYFIDTNPVDEFEGRLFDDWSDEEFCKYFSFMLECTQLYLQGGLIAPPVQNLNLRKLIEGTNQDFILWAVDNLESHKPYTRKEIYEAVTEAEPDLSKRKQNTITRWVKQLVEFSEDLRMTETKSNSKRVVTFYGQFPKIVSRDGVFMVEGSEDKNAPEDDDSDVPF